MPRRIADWNQQLSYFFTENTPSHEPPKHKFKKSKSSDKSLKLDIPLETGPRLEHLVKDRPRRPKNRPTTHVNNQPVVIDVLDKGSQEGIDGFFNSGTTQQPKSPNYSSEKDDRSVAFYSESCYLPISKCQGVSVV